MVALVLCGPSCVAQRGEPMDYLLVPGAGRDPEGGRHPFRGTGRPGRRAWHVLLAPRPTWAPLTCGCSPGVIGPCPFSRAPSSPSRCSQWRTRSPLLLAVAPPGPFLPQPSADTSAWQQSLARPPPCLGGPTALGCWPAGCVESPPHLSLAEAVSTDLGVQSAEASSPSAGSTFLFGVETNHRSPVGPGVTEGAAGGLGSAFLSHTSGKGAGGGAAWLPPSPPPGPLPTELVPPALWSQVHPHAPNCAPPPARPTPPPARPSACPPRLLPAPPRPPRPPAQVQTTASRPAWVTARPSTR